MKRVKIEELFIGAWVHEYLRTPDRYSIPMYVAGVYEDETVYLDFEGNEGDPFESKVSDIHGLVIDEDLLLHFGFTPAKGDNVWMLKVADMRLTIALKWKHGSQVVRRAAISGRTNCWNEELRCIHELQRWWVDKVYLPFGVPLTLKYK